MKNTLKKVLAFMLVFSFVFAFAACKDDSKETTAAATTLEETTAATTAAGETTTITGETTTAAATTPGETTTAAATVTAPVGGTPAQIVAFYNQYANATKAYKGTVKVSKSDGTATTITSLKAFGGNVPKIVVDKAQEMIPNDYSKKDDVTFVNGKSGNNTLAKHLPLDYSDKMSTLEAAGVASATCVQSGTGWIVTINLKPETVGGDGIEGVNKVPKYTSQCMDTLSMSVDDLDPFTVESATVNYKDCKIVAVFNSNGLITKIDVDTPAYISGVLKYIIRVNAEIVGVYKGNYTLTY